MVRVRCCVARFLSLHRNHSTLYRSTIHTTGGYSFALQDYFALNITQDIDSAGAKRLFEIVDAISYTNRLVMPKLMISAGGDEFQMPDDQRYWRDQVRRSRACISFFVCTFC